MAFKIILGSVAAALLVACTTPAPPPATGPVPGGPAAGVCNAQGAQFAIGKAAGASVVEEARQRSGAYMARVLRPNQVVTMEFNAQRLNLDINAAGVVTGVRCG
ncbi:MAG: I78 family peptidase inhibitor [Polaromonas sp.]|uniref:I78 family peptidase inhibitor n=1 Tax=Polaromonas sp. TaxID=1869339 RepID=UPI004035962F